ncbi:MAG: YkgJ family cysteine cluster protein [Betaproteobacteria bacterium]|nr:YkgJ family cysteine cluster protein [Betaproteobacteria bacterium]
MPLGKPAGVRCVQLDAANGCMIFGLPERPTVCASLMPAPEMCGDSAPQAMLWLSRLEQATA